MLCCERESVCVCVSVCTASCACLCAEFSCVGYPHVLAALCMCADFNGQVTFVFCAACVIAQPTVHACVEDNLCACGVICVCVHVPMWESVCVCVWPFTCQCARLRVCVCLLFHVFAWTSVHVSVCVAIACLWAGDRASVCELPVSVGLHRQLCVCVCLCEAISMSERMTPCPCASRACFLEHGCVLVPPRVCSTRMTVVCVLPPCMPVCQERASVLHAQSVCMSSRVSQCGCRSCSVKDICSTTGPSGP